MNFFGFLFVNFWGKFLEVAAKCRRDSETAVEWFGAFDFFGWRNFQAEPRQGFFGFFLPVGAAKTLRCNGVPVTGFGCVLRFFLEGALFPCDHRITGPMKKL